jgi:hypothetical protein
MARETCAHCGRELWHTPGGWLHLFTISLRSAMKKEPGCESAEAPA